MSGIAASPDSVVTAFIAAMNAWEVAAWGARRQARGSANPESYWPEVEAALDRAFNEFCTPRERKQGRQASFRRPPEYDPGTERIVGSGIVDNRAHVETVREAPLGGGSRRYVLHRRDGKWLIDNVQEKSGDTWRQAIL